MRDRRGEKAREKPSTGRVTGRHVAASFSRAFSPTFIIIIIFHNCLVSLCFFSFFSSSLDETLATDD